MSIILTYGGYSLTLETFQTTTYPRTRFTPYSVEFSANGTPLRRGSSFEPKHTWAIASAELTETQMDIADRIHGLYMLDPGTIVIDDLIQYYVDSTTTRTRALATGGAEISDTVTVKYFAKFNAEILEWSLEEVAPNSRLKLLNATLIETTLYPAA